MSSGIDALKLVTIYQFVLHIFTILILISTTVRKSSIAAKVLQLVFQFCSWSFSFAFYLVTVKMQIVSVIIVILINIKGVRVVLWWSL